MNRGDEICVWVTKYALTSGIRQHNVEVCGSDSPDMVRDLDCQSTCNFFHRKDFYLTKEAAVARAHEMRVSKIASLKKQTKKLEGMKF